MCTLDERILEHLDEEDWSSPTLMSQVIRFDASRGRIRERCELLSQVGLAAPVVEDSWLYEITLDGQAYLDGRLDVENRPWPSPRVVRRRTSRVSSFPLHSDGE